MRQLRFPSKTSCVSSAVSASATAATAERKMAMQKRAILTSREQLVTLTSTAGENVLQCTGLNTLDQSQ
eukprot:m.29000 g.29000  ORF g.29000 m.29000 type:complete len:69 (-) comp11910_c0_seq1:73-279(-)